MNSTKKINVVSWLFLLLAILFAFLAGKGWLEQKIESDKLEELSHLADQPSDSAEIDQQNDKKEPTLNEEAIESVQTSREQYKKLKEMNPDFYGWVKIPDTQIDYPVMYTPKENEKYLRKNFDGEYSIAGIPFLDSRCTPDSSNLILYGHNMKNGTMFQNILKYKEEEFYHQHPVIYFDTLNENGIYKILAAFYDQIYGPDYTGFEFYNFVDAQNENAYKTAVEYFKSHSLYDTGISAEYGDQLLTMVTCSYHQENGRFVVVAKKI